MKGLAETMRRELRAAGPGEALAAALLISAMYLEPVFGTAPWQASLILTCLAGGVLVVLRPARLRLVPLVLVAYVAVYVVVLLVSGVSPDAERGSEIARYIVRPVALAALSLFLVTPDSRRRVLLLLVIVALPQVFVTAWQTVDAVIEWGRDAAVAVDSVTGTFGASDAGTVGLVALGALCLVGGLAFAGLIGWRLALGLAAVVIAVEVFTSTRSAVVFAPLAAVALVIGTVIALGRRAPPRRVLVGAVLVGALAAPLIYAGTEAIYPGSFAGALSNQSSLVLEGKRVESEGGGPGKRLEGRGYQLDTRRGIALLPGRATQIKRGVEISAEDGARVFLFGRGFGAAAVPEDAVPGSVIPKEQTTGATWLGRNLGDAGWAGTLAFFGLIGWLAWLGIRIARHPASPSDRALGFALPAFAALTIAGAGYTTILDVRSYSAMFIVLAAAAFAAARDASGVGADSAGNGRRARASTPLPPRQHATSSAPSASSARSS